MRYTICMPSLENQPKKSRLFVVSGFVPFLGLLATPPTTMLLLYSIFVFASLRGRTLWQRLTSRKYLLLTLLSIAILVLLLSETCAWFNNFFEGFKHTGALFSTDYGQNLLLGFPYYFGMTIAWWIVRRFFLFSPKQAFVTYGLMGIFLEQQGAVFRQAIAVLPVNAVIAFALIIVVFFAHGSILGLIHLGLEPHAKGQRTTLLKYPAAMLCILVVVGIVTNIGK
jgi:hypothetical protein